ncbi:MAG: site-specific DNA-methyltransferase [Acidobacteriota bacterium]
MTWSVLCTDVLEGLAALPSDSVQCVVTSPPYWGLRDYSIPPTRWADGTVCCLGLEPTPHAFVEHLVEVFDGVRRVLRADGVCWVNLGDTYAGGRRGPEGDHSNLAGTRNNQAESRKVEISKRVDGVPDTNLLGIPWRFALAAQSAGWFLRQNVIWHKSNPFPETITSPRWERCRRQVGGGWQGDHPSKRPEGASRSGCFGSSGGTVDSPGAATWEPCPGCSSCEPNDGFVLRRGSWRPTTAHEHLFMLTNSSDYFGCGESVREPLSPKTRTVKTTPRKGEGVESRGEALNAWMESQGGRYHPNGRNLRSVWQISTQPFSGAHFATFPERLVEPCILSSTPEAGCCSSCGTPWLPIIERRPGAGKRKPAHVPGTQGSRTSSTGWRSTFGGVQGHRPACDCDAPARPSLVLDPFAGSGTTGLVALRLGRSFLGLERSLAYCSMARDRIGEADPNVRLSKPAELAPISGPLFEEGAA